MTVKERAKKYIYEITVYEFAVPKTNLSEFIDLCDELDVAITGFEGIKISSNSHLPLLDWIADFSSVFKDTSDWSILQKSSIKSSRLFLSKIDIDDIHFIPSLCTKEEWISRMK